MSTALIHAQSLRRSYGGQPVIDIDELVVRRGEVLAILGPNGAGKSTLFRLLLRIERPDAGRISFTGSTMAGVFQRPFLFAGSVRDNIAFGLRKMADRQARIASAANAFGLEAILDASVRTLSGGEAQRVALARAIALRPDVLLLDEPTANLDVLIKRSFREDVERAARTHAGAVVLITHDPAEAFALADRIAVLDNGRIVQAGTPEDMLDDPRTPFVASFTGAELLLDGVITTVAEELVQVAVGSALLWATMSPAHKWSAAAGMRAHVSYRPEDVMISVLEATTAEVSARNQFRLRITAMSGSGGLVWLRLDGALKLSASVTRTSVESLGLRPGRDVIAHMKATALRVLRSA
ncbi:MAG: ABC transporter ATP-binding protein [Gemmatimonadota bacterium]